MLGMETWPTLAARAKRARATRRVTWRSGWFLSQSSGPAELDFPPELSASLCAQLCTAPGDCGNYALHALDVQAGGESAPWMFSIRPRSDLLDAHHVH
jgi:hypothetical protein